MAYTAFNTTEIASGEPVKGSLWTKAKNNFSDHESRISSLESASFTFMPLQWHLEGEYADLVTFDGFGAIYRIPTNINVQNVRLLVRTAGSSSSTEIDIKYKRGAGSWTSIFSTKPLVASSAGDYALSSNQVLSTTALQTGDLIRCDLTACQQGTPIGLDVFLEFTL